MYKEVTITTGMQEYIICGETSDNTFILIDNDREDASCIWTGAFIECMIKLALELDKEK